MKKLTWFMSCLLLALVGLQVRAADIYVESTDSTFNVYTWSPSTFGEWPGEVIANIATRVKIGEKDYFKFSLNASSESGTSRCIIFNKDGAQTPNISLVDGDNYFVYPVNGDYTCYETTNPPVAITSYTVVGDAALFGSEWNTELVENDMVLQEDGSYKLVKNELMLSAGNYEYKVVGNHVWSLWEVPQQGNQTLTIEEDGQYDVTFILTLGEENVLTAMAQRVGDPQPQVYVLHYGKQENEWQDKVFVAGEDENEGKLVAADVVFEPYTEFGVKCGDVWYGGMASGGESTYWIHATWCTDIPLSAEEGVKNFIIYEGGIYTFILTVNDECKTFTVKGFNKRGDMNGDGEVDIADVNAIINMMLNKAEVNPAADLTGDSEIDIADVNMVIDIMLNKI